MTLSRTHTFNHNAADAGIRSLASAGLLTQVDLTRLISSEASSVSAGQIYADAQRARKDALILEKNILTRASPLLPRAVRLGLRQPGASLRDYEEWFGQRAAQYANPGDVASMFSPAAYLTALYREACAFYTEDNPFHINQRRPDIAGLALSQNTMDDEISTLDLSIEIILAKVRDSMIAAAQRSGQKESDIITDDAVMKMLSTQVTSIGTPYHHHHSRLRQVCRLKDPGFNQLAASPAATRHLSESSLAAIHYDIPPALYQLLTDEITDDNAQEKYAKYFGRIPPEILLNPLLLRRWYGLSDSELREFIGDTSGLWETQQSETYINNLLSIRKGAYIYRLSYEKTGGMHSFDCAELYPLGKGKWQIKIKHFNGSIDVTNKQNIAEILINGEKEGHIDANDVGDDVLLQGKEYTTTLDLSDVPDASFLLQVRTKTQTGGTYVFSFKYNTWVLHPYSYILKLNKAIRLYTATGLSPRVLEAIVNSISPDHINDDTFSLLFRSDLLMKQYALSHQDALVMARSLLSQSTHETTELSQFDRLFNNPSLMEDGFQVDDNKKVNFSPDEADKDVDIKATLKRACQTDDAGLEELYYCRHMTSTTPAMLLTLVNLSQMYTLSLWARLHGLTPAELRQLLSLYGLPDDLSAADLTVWNRLLDQLQTTTRWLREHGWGVQELVLMTHSVSGVPASADIRNFLLHLQGVIASSASAPELQQKIILLAPQITATFNLSSDSVGQTLLHWAHQAKPGGTDLNAFWQALSSADGKTQAGRFGDKTVAFAYGLAQKALIIHASGVTSEALALFVANPTTLESSLPSDAVLPCNLTVIIAMTTAAEWLATLADNIGAGGALIEALHTTGVDARLLAQATGLSEVLTAQAISAAQAKEPATREGILSSYSEIEAVLQWIHLAATFGVMPVDVTSMLTLDYGAGTGSRDDWTDWRQVANAFSSGLTPVQTAGMEALLAPGMANALSGWLTSLQSEGAVASSREELHRTLLIDSLNGPQVKTTRLAAAVDVLQTFIHRAMAEPAQGGFNTAALSSAFLRDWTQWNSRYSTWAAAQKLMYYPENYIDPTVRLGQTQMMDDMLQVLGQAQINTDTVGDAFMGYLNGFEAVANLETVSAYYDARYDSGSTTRGKTWFIGRSESDPREYWWRTVDEQKRGPEGKLPANAWTGWTRITCSPQPYGELIRPVVYKKRLYLGWVERQRQGTILPPDEKRNREDTGTDWEYLWTLKIAWLRYDGNWSTPASYPLSVKDIDDLEKIKTDNLSLYLSAWPEQQYMMAAIYDRSKGFSATQEIVNWGAMRIFEDMHAEPYDVAPDLITVMSQLDTPLRRGVCAVYFGVAPVVEPTLNAPSSLPGGFIQFDGGISTVKLHPTEKNDGYQLQLEALLTVKMDQPDYYGDHLHHLLKEYPELAEQNQKCTAYLSSQTPGYAFVMVEMKDDINKIYFSYHKDLYNERGCYGSDFDKGEDLFNILNYSLVNDTEGEGLIFESINKDVKLNYVFGRGCYIDSWLKFGPTLSKDGTNQLSDTLFFQLEELPMCIKTTITPKYCGNYITSGSDITIGVFGGDDEVKTISLGEQDYDIRNKVLSFQSATFPNKDTTYKIADWGDGKTEYHHKITFQCGKGNTRDYTLRVYKQADKLVADLIVSHEAGAQYLQHGGYRTRLNTLFARQLTERAASGIDTILSYETQQLPEPPTGEGAYLTVTLPAWNRDNHSSREVRLDLDEDLFWSGNLATTAQSITLFVPFNQKTINGIDLPMKTYCRVWMTINDQRLHRAQIRFKTISEGQVTAVELELAANDKVDDILHKLPEGFYLSLRMGDSEPMDFSGANALYFWELFYYTPMMVMQRFLQEARFDQAENWLNYVFNPAGYLINGEHTARMWNVRPLNEDISWNSEPMETWDPDAVAQNDPMHYKLNAFMRLLDIIIGRGDAAYRRLERDTLSEARVWYDRALSLLGESPWIAPNAGWSVPSLEMAANGQVQHDRFDALSGLAQGQVASSERTASAVTGDTLFYPQANEIMLDYWETLHLRRYNLRHSLTLDGQPLNLAPWATPADPKALLASAVASEDGADGSLPDNAFTPALRFTPLLESARGMASQLIQFGGSLQQVLERHDSGEMAELLLSQGSEMADGSLALQKQMLNELAAERTTLIRSLENVTTRRDHYEALYQENINAREVQAMDQLTNSQIIAAGAKALHIAAGAAELLPNIYGMAVGGSRFGGLMNATGIGITIGADALSIAGQRLSQEEMYRRRREEWDIQRKLADGEKEIIESQIEGLRVRETSLNMQIQQMTTQLAHARAQLALMQSHFTGKAMYSWLRSRLSTIFFQFYDLTASRCLMAQKALQWEKHDNTRYLKTGTWNGSWAGLSSGEGLMLSLAQMEDAWLRWQRREKEIVHTLSLNDFFKNRLDDNLSLADAVRQLLTGTADASLGEGKNKVERNGDQLAIHFDLAEVALNKDGYGNEDALRRVRTLAVTLPTLLGPYQDVRAVLRTLNNGLPPGCDECAISHAQRDNGVIQSENGDPRWLPFEGLPLTLPGQDPVENGMTLSFADATGDQQAMLENLSDVIIHIQYSLR